MKVTLTTDIMQGCAERGLTRPEIVAETGAGYQQVYRAVRKWEKETGKKLSIAKTGPKTSCKELVFELLHIAKQEGYVNQAEIARKAGVTRAMVNKLIKGAGNIK